MALRALKTEEEIAGIPLDQPILVELPGGVVEDEQPSEKKETKKPDIEPDAKRLQEQLEAAQAAQQAERARAERAEREAAQRTQEADQERKRRTALESDVVTGGLSAAQSERDAAKQALQAAGEAGDWKAIADAQSRIGRAEAKILSYESGAAEIAERVETEKRQPTRQEVLAPQSFAEQIKANPQLMQSERDWMLRNEAAFGDADFNKKLDFAYRGAMSAGLVRGSQAYFDHIERATGLVADNTDRSTSVQAPPSRQERDSSGRPSSNRVTLTPEERDIAKSLGVSEIDYAKNKMKFEEARRADPDKYR